VVLTSVLIHKGSHESKDSAEQMQTALERIEQRLAALARKAEGDGRTPVPAAIDMDAALPLLKGRVSRNDQRTRY
jgi:hypothetical protein